MYHSLQKTFASASGRNKPTTRKVHLGLQRLLNIYTLQCVALTMLKEILVVKLYGTKRCELRWCKSAKDVKKGMIVVHLAGRFVGEFRVVETETFDTILDALRWRPHTQFLPDSPSIEATVKYYQVLMSKSNAAEGKCKLYAWEDEIVSQYVVEGNKTRVPWVFPLQCATI